MAELESAEELLFRLVKRYDAIDDLNPVIGRSDQDQVVELCCAIIEADRAAIALAAKRELLKEIASDVAELAGHKGVARGYEYAQALKLIARKYTAAEPAVETREW